MLGLSPGLTFDLLGFNGMTAVDALPHSILYGGTRGILPMGAFALVKAIGGEGYGSLGGGSICLKSHPPLFSISLGKPAGVEKGRIPAAVRARDLTAVEVIQNVLLVKESTCLRIPFQITFKFFALLHREFLPIFKKKRELCIRNTKQFLTP
jgi:hypothetical protein